MKLLVEAPAAVEDALASLLDHHDATLQVRALPLLSACCRQEALRRFASVVGLKSSGKPDKSAPPPPPGCPAKGAHAGHPTLQHSDARRRCRPF